MPATTTHRAHLRSQVRAAAQNRPGVYRITGTRGEVIYVGKSKRLRTRLLSYFRAPRGSKAARIVEEARGVEWSYEPSEFAALLAELRQIRTHQPRLNRQLKRSDAHLFLRITAEAAPRVALSDTAAARGGVAFGPFRGRRRLRRVARELNDHFQLRDCPANVPIRFSDQPDLFGHRPVHRCARPELGRCLAPCAASCSETTYRSRVRALERFLAGEDAAPAESLRAEMEQAAEGLRFEYAVRLRDRLALIEGVMEDVRRLREEVLGLAFLYAAPSFNGDARLYLVHRGCVHAEAPYSAARPEIVDAAWTLTARRGAEPPLTGAEMQEALIVARWFRAHEEERLWTVPIEAAAAGRLPPLRNDS